MLSPAISFRIATDADIPAISAVANAAFEIETFLEGNRTDEKNIAEMMGIGEFLIMEDELRRVLASVYVEVRGERGYFGMFAVEPSSQSMGLGRLIVGAAEEHCRSRGCK
ncbi:MAG TPA: GNAT family N-acetyltransferase, partial [Candidatus Kapabacteria bacterium]|nr:GNAT family N-acetyltransferase [Candidatus Kapabacteria bacterium]